ncbi:MAG: L,D-transpeptidase [Bacillota bacterium]
MVKRRLYLFLGFLFLGFILIASYPGTFADMFFKEQGATSFPEESLKKILKDKGFSKKLQKPLLYISKSKCRLTLYEGGIVLKSYSIAMGQNFLEGAKEREGDRRTPEGRYFITEKRVVFPPKKLLGSRWLGISYPAKGDVERGYSEGILSEEEYLALMRLVEEGEPLPQKTPLGGEIGVHGGHAFGKEFTWTLGCVALTNHDIEEIYPFLPIGTPVIIIP